MRAQPSLISAATLVAPQMSMNITFGMDLARGAFIIEGATISASLPVNGTLVGTATIGNWPRLRPLLPPR